MKLKYQLFLALLAGGGILIMLVAGVAALSFDRGFLDYVNRIEQQRLEPLREALVTGYAQHGNWRWVSDDPRRWRSLVRDSLRQDERRQRPLPLDRSLLLADENKTVLVSHRNRSAEVSWSPLTLDSRVIGYLGDLPLRRAPAGIDRVFAERHRRSLVYASLALLPLSALMAWILTNRIVRPIDQLNTAIARIGDGNFSHRLPATRRDELGDLSRQVNRLAQALEKNLHARQRWLAEISHELRTPVAVLQAELEAMQDGVMAVNADALGSLHDETMRLSILIDDLRDLTLADAGALNYQFELVDIATIVIDLLEQSQPRLETAELTLQLHGKGPLSVQADPQRITQLVNNLLQNSLRYTDPGGHLHVTLEKLGESARLVWSDSMPGVSDSDLPHLFDPLYRADDSRDRDSGGSGLGLAIAQKITEAHGGSIHAHHSALGGLTIELQLPLSGESQFRTAAQ